ncbi:MAG TPA: hypothetical protein VGJ28_04995 [Micromonosporaceae bacterium]
MTSGLRDALRELAEQAPAPAVPPGLYEKARRTRRRRRLIGAAAALSVVALTGIFWYAQPPAPIVPAAPASAASLQLPSVVVAAPHGTDDIRDAPLPAALAVFAGRDEADPLTLVGPDDQYRVYHRPEWTSANIYTPTFLLSPNGRYLLMDDTLGGSPASRLLDVTTGDVRVLTAGDPLAWSPDGRMAVFQSISYDTNVEIRVADMPSGHIVNQFSMTLDDPTQAVTASFSADNASLAVAAGRFLTVREANTIRGQGFMKPVYIVMRIAGPDAWPDGSSVLLLNNQCAQPCADSGELVSVDTGRPLPAGSSSVAPIAHNGSVIGWRGMTPVVAAGNRILFDDETTISAPPGTPELAVAVDGLSQPLRSPGRPNPGPRLPGFRLPLLAVLSALAVVLVAGLFMRRRFVTRK